MHPLWLLSLRKTVLIFPEETYHGEDHEPAGSTQISPTDNPIGEQGNILRPENDTAGEKTEVVQPQAQEKPTGDRANGDRTLRDTTRNEN